MKAYILIAVAISCFSAVTFAEGRKATKEEVKMLCAAIDQQMEDQQIDMAINYKKCLKSKMQFVTDEEGTVIIGKVPFRAPSRPEFINVCIGTVVNAEIDSLSIDCSLSQQQP